MKGRRWTKEEDQLLSETVLHTISQGGTQLTAFSEVGKKIGRTAGACGFRWNAVLRGQHPRSYSEAKKRRVYSQLEKKRKAKVESFAEAIELLAQFEKAWKRQKVEIARLKKSLGKLGEKIEVARQEQKKFQREADAATWVQQEVKTKYAELVRLLEQLQQKTESPPTTAEQLSVGKTDVTPLT
jgi:prespore-specific regulator